MSATAEQVRTAYTTKLEQADLSPADVAHVTEHVTVAGLTSYDEAVAAREALFGEHRPTVTTVVVEALSGSPATFAVDVDTAPDDGTVHLPTMVPVDDAGEVVAPGDFVGQYRYCLEQADVLLRRAGLSLADAVTTYDYSTPETRSVYRKTHHVRKDLLGGKGVYPGAGGILMSRLHQPGQLVAIDVTASRQPLETINPGWERYDTLTYSPGVRAGRTLFMSGFAALDMDTQEALHPDDLAAQAEATYGAVLHLLAYAGLGPEHLVRSVELCVERAAADHRVVADVRKALFGSPGPAATELVCHDLLRPEFLLEVFPTAHWPEEV